MSRPRGSGEVRRAGNLKLRWYAWRGSKGMETRDRIPFLLPLPILVARRNQRLDEQQWANRQEIAKVDAELLAVEAMAFLGSLEDTEGDGH